MAARLPVDATSSSSSSFTSKRLISTPTSSHRLPTVSAAQEFQDAQAIKRRGLSTGLCTLDDLLGKGLGRGKVHELWGPSGSGKTALALQTATCALNQGASVVWVDCATSLSGPRLRDVLDTSAQTSTLDCLQHFRHITTPMLSHLLALIVHPLATFPADGTALLIIDGLSTLLDLDYPRSYTAANKSEAQKWQQNRRYAVLGSLVLALNKMAVIHDLAVLVTTGCATRMRPGSGMGAVLVPGVGGQEWDNGIWSRVVCFRDFGGRFVGVTKVQGKSLATEEGATGQLAGFEMTAHGALTERKSGTPIPAAPPVIVSPAKPRKRTFDEVADSDGEDAEEFGWAEEDGEAAEGLMLSSEGVDLTEDAEDGVG